MVYQCLLLSDKIALDYCEIDVTNREISTGYDFYLFNYHPATMKWLDTKHLKRQLGFVGTIILEVAPGDPFVMCPSKDFSFYCALDPTLRSAQKNVYSFPRPLDKVNFILPELKNEIPVIGSFGFATKGKGFQHVVDAVNKEFDKAIIRINIPYGDFVPNSKEYAAFLGDICKQRAKPGIQVEVTHDFMSKEALIRWCASNTLNCFLYDRNMPGLAATTDQAIVSGRPLSVSDNDTFRHITAYLPAYPVFSLQDAIDKSIPILKKMQDDWSPEKFARQFDDIIRNNLAKINEEAKFVSGKFILPLKNYNFMDTVNARWKKYTRRLKKLNFNIFNKANPLKRPHEII